MEFFRIDNLSIGIGQFTLQKINLSIPRGEVLVVLGSSGSGKSILLESIAGFNRPRQGQIWLDGREITAEPPEKRQIGFMFQDYALFPHLTVWENITYSMRFHQKRPLFGRAPAIKPDNLQPTKKKLIPSDGGISPETEQASPVFKHMQNTLPNTEQEYANSNLEQSDVDAIHGTSDRRSCAVHGTRGISPSVDKSRHVPDPLGVSGNLKVSPRGVTLHRRLTCRRTSNLAIDPGEIVNMLRINHLLTRYPTQLSGGEKQRVAMARALVQRPKLFLLDEPMSALDARTREELREELGGLFKRLSLTVIYVTHDQTEALALADQVCILNAGKIEQSGTKEVVFNNPANAFVAKFVGMENVSPGVVLSSRMINCIREHNVQVQGWGTLKIRSDPVSSHFKTGEIINVGIRPEDILTGIPKASNQSPEDNHLDTTIRSIVPWGVIYKLYFGETTGLTALVTKHHLQSLNLRPNTAVRVNLPPESLHLMPSDEQ